jgi:hypothetical protein
MKKRCPGHEVVGKATLEDYRWIINKRGYANVVPSKNDVVEGVLSWLTEDDEIRLDMNEGVAKGSYRKEYLYVRYNGQPTLVLVYVDPIVEEGSPASGYIDRINKGLDDAKLSDAYVKKYIRPFVPAAKS